MSKRAFAAMILAGAVATACGGAGMGATVRTDISTRMQTLEAPVAACYARTLETNRKARGMMILSFDAAPGTGQFTNIQIRRDELNEPAMKQCVVTEVGKLKLAQPQKTKVSVDSYPLHFAPIK